MISASAFLGIAAVSLVMVLTPGPNMMYLISRSLIQGRRAGLISLMGIAVGFFIYLIAAIGGITTVFTLVPALYTTIKIAGAVYLLWIAWNTVRPSGQSIFTPRELPVDPPRKLLAMGVMTTLFNPKIAIMYVSLLPQFVNPKEGHVGTQSLILGLIQISISLVIDAVYVLTASVMATFLGERPKWMQIQRYLMGILLAAFGLRIAVA
ncbi:LysE family translocator [Streptomyces sp. NPDC005407]|uniref:LysE family translocator n=1 Tax=Streptomyces sp. NPDC005407 TaxID=3155340 RepID=UPI0033A7BA3E